MYNKFLQTSSDLVTTHEQTRTGFLAIALEKNRISDPYVKNALAFKSMTIGVTRPEDLLTMPQIRPFLITAAGLSDKSLNYLDEKDQEMAIQELIEKFLKPAGDAFIDEIIYRYLLIKGDSVGGTMRNRIGALGQEKLIRAILSTMNVRGMDYTWYNTSKKWNKMTMNDAGIESSLKAISWNNSIGSRVLAFNLNIPIVRKNVDICLFDCNQEQFNNGKIVNSPEKTIMLGELKGGIDPAGADEHWKTANTALQRIRDGFSSNNLSIKTSFIGAAIEAAMATELFMQLEYDILDNAANLTDTNQLTEYCNWILDL